MLNIVRFFDRELHGNRIQNISRNTFNQLTSLQVL